MRWHGKEAQVSERACYNCFFAISLMLVIVAIVIGVIVKQKEGIRKQAIERGHAEYVVDSDGKTTWQWKEK